MPSPSPASPQPQPPHPPQSTPTPIPIPAHNHNHEHSPLLPPQSIPEEPPHLPTSITLPLSLSHLLSTWNSRTFEFGAVLFLATIFPGTLLPTSLYALVRAGAAVVCAPWVVGGLVDGDGDGDGERRLRVVRGSIVGQRIAVAASCLCFWYLWYDTAIKTPLRYGIFAVLALLACVEKLAAILNLVAVERDWVVVIAGDNEKNLRDLNSQMRRIDLCCKLGGPLFIALLDGISTNIAILTTLAMNILSVGVEYYAIANVFNTVPTLRHPPTLSTPTPTTTSTSSSETTTTTPFLSTLQSLLPALTFYLTHPAFLPSISLSLLYFTVLSFGGNMVAYLLSAHYSSTNVGIIRTVAVIFEISATWIAPGVMSRMGPVRAGMWFLSWQMIWLTGGVVGFLRGGGGKNDDGDDGGFLAASWLVVGVVASRVGLWGFDLCAQIIIQEEVSPPTRGTFSSIESSFQNTFELASFAATMVFSRPDQFRYPVLMSCGAIYVAGALYAAFVRRRRGHLLHFSKCVGEVKGKKRGDDGVERPLLAGLVEGDGGREGGRGREEV